MGIASAWLRVVGLIALTFAALLCPCGYNVHRNSGIALATIDGSVVGKSAAAAASSGVASTGSPPVSGGGAPAFAGGPLAAGVRMTAGGAESAAVVT